MVGGIGRDRVFVTPSATVPFTVSGGAPSVSPGDVIALRLAGVSGATFIPGSAGAGTYTFSGRQPVAFSGIESRDNLQPPHLSSSLFDPGMQQLVFGFDDDVSDSLTAAALSLSNLTTGLPVSANGAAIHYDFAGNLASFALGNLTLDDGNYHSVLSGSAVTDESGNALTGDAAVDFFLLRGDANHDRYINSLDFAALAQSFNTVGASFGQGDFNGDGKVNAVDFNILASKFGAYLPPVGGAAPLAIDGALPAIPQISLDLFSHKPIEPSTPEIL
jgi:hypothetical protein